MKPWMILLVIFLAFLAWSFSVLRNQVRESQMKNGELEVQKFVTHKATGDNGLAPEMEWHNLTTNIMPSMSVAPATEYVRGM